MSSGDRPHGVVNQGNGPSFACNSFFKLFNVFAVFSFLDFVVGCEILVNAR